MFIVGDIKMIVEMIEVSVTKEATGVRDEIERIGETKGKIERIRETEMN